MPYCPKCDMEFIDGITVCTDCGGPLVESKEAAEAMKAAEMEKKRELEREQELAWQMEMEQETADDAPYAHESGQDQDAEQGHSASGQGKDAPAGRRSAGIERTYAYVDTSQRYNDLKSSASAFMIVGCILTVASVLLWTGIVNLPMAPVSRMIFRGGLTLMAAFSLVVSLNTRRSAGKLAPMIDQEKRRTEELIRWFTDNYSAEDIDREIADSDSLSPEELSLRRFQLIQDHLVTNQDLPDPSYVDALCEEIYPKIFAE